MIKARLEHACLFILALCTAASVSAAERFELFRSTDAGGSWVKAGEGLPSDLRIEGLGESGNVRLAGSDQGVYLSYDDGRTWIRPKRGIPERLKVFDFAAHEGRVYAATWRGIWVSADDGRTWDQADSDLKNLKVMSVIVNRGHVFAGTDDGGVFVKRDQLWLPLGSGLPERSQVFELAAQDGVLFAALYARGIYRYDSTADKWISSGKEFPLQLVEANGILYSGRNPGGVFVSRNGGATWREASLGLPKNAATWMLARVGTSIFIGTNGVIGLLRTEDGGEFWHPSDRGLPADADAIALGANDKSLLVVVITVDRPN